MVSWRINCQKEGTEPKFYIGKKSYKSLTELINVHSKEPLVIRDGEDIRGVVALVKALDRNQLNNDH